MADGADEDGGGQHERASPGAPARVGSFDLDVAAAVFRADGGDTERLFDVLGDKLVRILGERVELKRTNGLRRRTRRVEGLVVTLGQDRLEAQREAHRPSFRVVRVVRGITLSTEEVDLDQWVDRLIGLLEQEAQRNSDVRDALARLLEA